MANYYDSSQKYNTQSAVFRAAGAKFIEYQEISTHGAHDMTSFEYKGHTLQIQDKLRGLQDGWTDWKIQIKTRVFACFWTYVSLQNGGFI